jgi:hypothetical protein
MSEIEKLRVSAAFGFYTNMLFQLKQLAVFIKPGATPDFFYLLLREEDRNGNGKTSVPVQVQDIKQTATDILLFLGSSNSQIPPSAKEREQWDKSIDELCIFLRKLTKLDEIYSNEFNTVADVDQYYKNTNTMLAQMKNSLLTAKEKVTI